MSLMVIAGDAIFHFEDAGFGGANPSREGRGDLRPARTTRAGDRPWIFGLGILAMALSSITMQMLASASPA